MTQSGQITPDTSNTQNNFEQLCEAVFVKKPIFKQTLSEHGHRTLYEYARQYLLTAPAPTYQNRSDEFINAMSSEVERLLGPTKAQSVTRQLRKYYVLSTADHHGPICHPFFINSNLLTALPYDEMRDAALENVIVLACGSVSLGNSSFPRGLIFNSVTRNGEVKNHRLSFFSAQHRMSPVYNFRPYTSEDMARVRHTVGMLAQAGDITSEVQHTIETIIDDIYLAAPVLASRVYSEQITKTNFSLWKKFFTKREPAIADLIYLEFESVVKKLLLDHHLTDTTVLHRMLFDPALENYVRRYFDGLEGAFSEAEGWGTYMFWALPPGAKYRLPLVRSGTALATPDGTYSVPLSPIHIQMALARGELIPGILLSYLVVSLYYGVKCLGGFSQVNYLTYIKEAYIAMLVELGYHDEAQFCRKVQTKELGADMNIAFLRGPRQEMYPATGLDLIVYGTGATRDCLIQQSKILSLEETFGPTMPELYRIIYGADERQPELLELTPEKIAHMSGLESKVNACVSVYAHTAHDVSFIRIWPGGNTTALVHTTHQRTHQAAVANYIMGHYTAVEQVGFIELATLPGSAFRLQMMGGEFCANAARSACYYWHSITGNSTIQFEVSGLDTLVEATNVNGAVSLTLPGNFFVDVRDSGALTVIDFEGIRFLVLPGSADVAAHDTLVDSYREQHFAVGIVYVVSTPDGVAIDPYVWVRDTGSFVHESACGSGSLAAALWHAMHHEYRRDLAVLQPSGERYTVELLMNSGAIAGFKLHGIVRPLDSSFIKTTIEAV